ncbi:hypothetical protein SRABI106_02682 [Rahnella aquatilis]|nr:hypothetical protein SRABI106_02682 [Rahnella aquatilis]
MLNGALTAGQFTAGRHVEHHFTQRTARLGFVAFQLIESVKRLFGGFDRLTHFPVSITAFYVQLGEEANGFHRTGVVQGVNGFLDNLLVLALIQLAFFAAPNQQNAF